jgi:tetratricopeptide (TPR) repeat protein
MQPYFGQHKSPLVLGLSVAQFCTALLLGVDDSCLTEQVFQKEETMSSRASTPPDRPRSDRKSLKKKRDTSLPKPVSNVEGSFISQAGVGSPTQASNAAVAPEPAAKAGVFPPDNGDKRDGNGPGVLVKMEDYAPRQELNQSPELKETQPRNEAGRFHDVRMYLKSRFSRKEVWVITFSALYLLAFVLLFATVWRGSAHPLMMLLFVAASILLDLAIVIAASSETFKVILVAIPTLAVALVGQVELIKIESNKTSDELIRVEDLAFRDQQRRLAEDVLVEPIAAIENGQNVHDGFRLKSNRLEVASWEREAALVAEQRDLLQLVLRFPDDPHGKLKSYERLRVARPQLAGPIEQVVRPLRDQIAYLDLADLFRKEIEPQYIRLKLDLESHQISSAEACDRVFQILDTLRPVAARYRVAGLSNHMGTMAMSCEKPDQALAFFYDAVSLDRRHIPAYESLAYMLWLSNHDERTALETVERGLFFCAAERNAVESSFRRTMESYDLAGQTMPAWASLAHRHREKLRRRMEKMQGGWAQFIGAMKDRLQNDFAYFSALQRRNEQTARSYIEKLYQLHPDDSDYQDTLGLVKMRFAKNAAELDEADDLFKAAIRNPAARPEQIRLASAHRQALTTYKAELQGRYGASGVK